MLIMLNLLRKHFFVFNNIIIFIAVNLLVIGIIKLNTKK